MRITQGTFSYLPDLTDEQITAQVRYCLDNGWPLSVEFTDDPHPRNFLWEMWELPMFDMADASAILYEINRCREAHPHHYIRLNAYDRTLGRQTTALSFIVNRPADEPGFRLDRQEATGSPAALHAARLRHRAARRRAVRPLMASDGRRRFGMSGDPAPAVAPGADRQAPAQPSEPVWDAAATVDVGAQLAEARIAEVLDALESDLVALEPVKTRIHEIASLLVIDRLRHGFGLESERPSLHMCFTGSPGTGKTTVALRMAEILNRLGYLAKGHLVTVTRDDLVGQYIGHTAPKTREVLKRAMGGVLFIDEAYYLYKQENERDYGAESIEILLQVMENQRSDVVVILAGYKDRMDVFFESNPGMQSRIAHHIDFPDYTLDELLAITSRMLESQHYTLSDGAGAAFRELLEKRMSMPRFANARSVRNALERCRLRQADRLVAAGGTVGRDDLMRIEAADVRKSRLLAATAGDAP